MDGERVEVALRLVALRQLGRVGAPQGVGLVVDDQEAPRGARPAGRSSRAPPLPPARARTGPRAGCARRLPRAPREAPRRASPRPAPRRGRGPRRRRPAPRAPGSSPAPRRWAAPRSVARSPRGQRGPRCRSPATARAAPRRERGSRRPRGCSPPPSSAGWLADGGRLEPDHPLDVEAVAAAGVGGERRIGEAAGRGGGLEPLEQVRRPREAARRRRPGSGQGIRAAKLGRPLRARGLRFAPRAAAAAPGRGHPRSPAPVRARRPRRRPSQPRPAERREEQLQRRVGRLRLLGGFEVGRAEGAAQDQPVLGSRDRHVDEPAGLLDLGSALLLAELHQLPEAKGLGGRDRQPHAESRPRSGLSSGGARRLGVGLDPADGDVAVTAPRSEPAPEVGHRDHRELEPLGGMHRHHPDAVVSLHLDRGHALALVAQGALLGELQKAAKVAALVLLVLGRQAHQLAHVGHSPPPSRAGQQGQVVVEGGDRPVDQRVERQQGRLVSEAGRGSP